MTTLDTAPLAALLHQLFIDADTTSALLKQQLDALPTVNRPSRLFNFRTFNLGCCQPNRVQAISLLQRHASSSTES
jgi:hypothetical protein